MSRPRLTRYSCEGHQSALDSGGPLAFGLLEIEIGLEIGIGIEIEIEIEVEIEVEMVRRGWKPHWACSCS